MPTKVISFGFKWGKPEKTEADHIIDIRPWFGRNPYHDKRLRGLRGTDTLVQQDIQKTPNFWLLSLELEKYVEKLDGVVALGCTGGHHRSVYLAELVSKSLGIPVEHRDFNKTKH